MLKKGKKGLDLIMKVILSRKGFDSGSGGIVSPIINNELERE